MIGIKKITSSGLSWLWVAVIIIIADRASKLWVINHLVFGEPLEVLPFFNLTLAFNKGAAFSMFHSASGWQNWVLGGLAAVVSLVILYWLSQSSRREWWTNFALSLVLGGAIGNAWDRLLYSHVIDFLDFHVGAWHFAIFNVADSAISIGACMLLYSWLRQTK